MKFIQPFHAFKFNNVKNLVKKSLKFSLYILKLYDPLKKSMILQKNGNTCI